ncbi:double homeobox protein A [Oryctolagus cuniculus]|uniref:double homeobox protein A n=1 Tax=Oryctolagus cuniculus TaxID=9986 RepID=UPI0022307EB6|nr:double homeobox protein A [Oryctolagus cuniculus]
MIRKATMSVSSVLSTEKLSKNYRRSRTRFTEEQLKILINAFNQKPYPGYATKQKLASEINTEESRIQVWFQNRRARHRFQKTPELKEALESSQGHGEDCPQEEIQNPSSLDPSTVQRESRRCRTNYSSSQLHTLIKAFMSNPYPGIDSREQLAKEIGVPESRIQIWFQNRRNRFNIQRKRKSNELLEQDPGEEH